LAAVAVITIRNIDLRAHWSANMAHPCLLGMGVHRDSRRSGIGHRLLAVATNGAKLQKDLDWVLLHVITSKLAALKALQADRVCKTGFVKIAFGSTVGKSTTCRCRCGAVQ
jgi:hypothetical protein